VPKLNRDSCLVLAADAIQPLRRAAAYLQAQVARQSGWTWPVVPGAAPGPSDVLLSVESDSGALAEEIAIRTGGADSPAVSVTASGPTVCLAAVGRLLRLLRLEPGIAWLPPTSLRERPAYPVRGHTFANHKQTNTYDKWSLAEWAVYLTDLAAWGANIAVFYPLHPARWPGALPFDEPRWFDSPEKEAEFDRQWEVQTALPTLCRELGLRYGLWMPVNDIFPDEVARDPSLTRHGGSYVCVSVPAARRRVRAIRERLFAALPHIDVLFFPSKDDGGCPACEHCHPWAPVYLDLAQEQYQIARAHHPGCRVWLAQQGLAAHESALVLQWLDRERPAWVEAMAFGPFSELMTFGDPEGGPSAYSLEEHGRSGTLSGPIERLRAALPGDYQLVLYPDEAHTFRCQYPVMHMDPAVQYVWRREDGPSVRPREMAAICATTAPASDGAAPYTEGNTDDLNKAIWSALCWDPSLSAKDVTLDYCRRHFGPAVADAATAMALAVEEALGAPLLGQPAVAEARRLLDQCEAIVPDLLSNWRWLNLRIAVLMLDYLQQVLERDRRLAAQLRYRVAAWRSWPDPTEGLRGTIVYLEGQFEPTRALLAEIVRTRDELYRLGKVAIRAAIRLQDSYQGLDRVLAEWRRVLERLERGELRDYAERARALAEPLNAAEESLASAMRGVPLVGPLQEFPWETGEPRW